MPYYYSKGNKRYLTSQQKEELLERINNGEYDATPRCVQWMKQQSEREKNKQDDDDDDEETHEKKSQNDDEEEEEEEKDIKGFGPLLKSGEMKRIFHDLPIFGADKEQGKMESSFLTFEARLKDETKVQDLIRAHQAQKTLPSALEDILPLNRHKPMLLLGPNSLWWQACSMDRHKYISIADSYHLDIWENRQMVCERMIEAVRKLHKHNVFNVGMRRNSLWMSKDHIKFTSIATLIQPKGKEINKEFEIPDEKRVQEEYQAPEMRGGKDAFTLDELKALDYWQLGVCMVEVLMTLNIHRSFEWMDLFFPKHGRNDNHQIREGGIGSEEWEYADSQLTRMRVPDTIRNFIKVHVTPLLDSAEDRGFEIKPEEEKPVELPVLDAMRVRHAAMQHLLHTRLTHIPDHYQHQDVLEKLYGKDIANTLFRYIRESWTLTSAMRGILKKKKKESKESKEVEPDAGIQHLLAAFKSPNCPVVKKPLEVYRGVEDPDAQKYMHLNEGGSFEDKSVTSWTPALAKAVYFADRDKHGYNCCVMRLKLPVGLKAVFTHTEEYELILPPGKFDITQHTLYNVLVDGGDMKEMNVFDVTFRE